MIELPETINSVNDAETIINQYNLRLDAHLQVGGHLVFRGQGRWEYELISTLARKFNSTNHLIQIEEKILSEFESKLESDNLLSYIRPEFKKNKFHKEWSWLQQAQHYGLPTRLLDWTISTQMALFFAVENSKNDDSDGQFWIFVVPSVLMSVDSDKDSYLNISPFQLTDTLFFNSGFLWNDNVNQQIAEVRKRTQMGRFSIQPYSLSLIPIEKQGGVNNNLIRITIPKQSKMRIREELKNMGFTHDSVYVQQIESLNNIIQDIKNKYSL